MTLLVCNVGGSDVLCAALPKERRGERAWAEEALARYDELRPLLHLPIIGKALRYLVAQQSPPEHVILIASDQPVPAASVTDRRFWESDTCRTAALITRCLADGSGGLPLLPAATVSTWIIADEAGHGGDPSDYDLVLRCLERRLAGLAVAHPNSAAFLEVTGGTPAMTTGLLIAGTEIFGARAELLSIHPRREVPAALGAGRRLLAAPLRATLRSNAATCAYDAALRTFREQRAAICDRLPPGAEGAIEALLAYAHCRYSFDFPGARAVLTTLPAIGPWRAELDALAAQVAAPTRVDLLAEVVHGAAARYDAGLYADFLTQLVRFEENLLRLLCLERGARFATRRDGGDDPSGSLLQRDWLRAQPFTLRGARDDEQHIPTSRALLRDLASELARARDEDLSELLRAVDGLRPLVYLRNDLTHSLDGVRRGELAARFSGRQSAPAGQADRIVPYLAELYARVAGRGLPPSPFLAINGLLDRLLHVDGP